MSNIVIVTETGPNVGLGHLVRSNHLRNVLDCELRQGDLSFRDNADLLVLDVMEPNNWLENHRKTWGRLVVIVGAGWTVWERPAAEADLLIYQAVHKHATVGNAITGPEWVMIDPAYATMRASPKRRGALIWFGAGIPRDYAEAVDGALSKSMDTTLVLTPEDRGALLKLHAQHKIHVGSMGMATFEAMAAGCVPFVVGRSPDHADTAWALAQMRVCMSYGLWRDVKPELLAWYAASCPDGLLQSRASGGQTLIDGKGIFRVAEKIRDLL